MSRRRKWAKWEPPPPPSWPEEDCAVCGFPHLKTWAKDERETHNERVADAANEARAAAFLRDAFGVS